MAVYEWQDITSQLKSACHGLPLGSLQHDENFGLFEAMSAIEMMDSKMDAGMLCNKDLCSVSSAEEALEKGILDSNPSGALVLGVADELLACMTTWLDGHSLAQTVLTCLYTYIVPQIENLQLKAICNAVLKCCEMINYIVNSASCFEEEDFLTCTYGFDLASKVTISKVVGSIKDAEDDIIRKSKKKDLSALDQAILDRLKFWRHLLLTLQNIHTFEKCNLGTLQDNLTSAIEYLPLLKTTFKLGTAAVPKTENQKFKTMVGFEYLINQRLLSSTPPRYIDMMEREPSFDYTANLLNHLDKMCKVVNCTSLTSIIRFFDKFSDENPSVLARSSLYHIFLIDDHVLGDEMFTKYIKEEVASFSCPPSFIPSISSDPSVKSIINTFLDYSLPPVRAYLHAMCHNRGRQRRRLASLLGDLGELYVKAEEFDTILSNHINQMDSSVSHLCCYSCWVLFLTVEVMVKYLLLGWELDLYGIHESHYVYCYLEYLFGWLRQTVIKGQELVFVGEAAEKKMSKKNKNSKKKKRERNHAVLLEMSQIYRMLAHAYLRAIEAFTIQGKLDKSLNGKFDREDLRFRQRFAPFAQVPMPVPLDMRSYPPLNHIKTNATPNQETHLFGESLRYFTSVRDQLERIPPSDYMGKLMKAVKMNCVVVKLAADGHLKNSTDPPVLDFKVCQNIPILRVT